MEKKTYTITSSEGLHARPCSLLVSAVTPFQSDVTIGYNGKKANMKSIMGVMGMGIESGAQVEIEADGADAAEAIAKVDEIMKQENIGE
ncbi:phosphocarrier protein HPr [Sporosarcina sp. NCCP-2716]|uniref:phosphocarrier protein HPr n=1 Tax=Sporosarcina sp. NCCP-2716 TaxID=2943679 RepID=UPI00203DCB2D|nr:phosphocarrier protein HPr [Sporosarcina sp. NCCP-2716]GKV68531.1 phosphocarrier protein HPr [Sporosarcina sp. NCCP-2716]